MPLSIVTDWKPYAPYFTESEFRCKQTGKCAMSKEYMDFLLEVRTELDDPMVVNSGYRGQSHTVETRKKQPGTHTYGVAADFAVSGGDVNKFLLVVLTVAERRGLAVGLGVQQKGSFSGRFIHVDLPDLAIQQQLGISRPWTYSY